MRSLHAWKGAGGADVIQLSLSADMKVSAQQSRENVLTNLLVSVRSEKDEGKFATAVLASSGNIVFRARITVHAKLPKYP